MKIDRFETIGAMVTDIDLKDLGEADFARLYRTWIECNVLCVRDQTLEITDFLAYSRRFGVVCPHPSKSTRHADHPELTVLGVNKFRPDGTLDNDIYRRGAEGFHTDGSYERVPYKATQLYALAIPSVGGDTFFSSAYAAYEALPSRLKEVLEGKQGRYVYGGRTQLNIALLDAAARQAEPVRHPLVRVHPESGRTLLYFDQAKLLAIEDMDEAASDAVIAELRAFMQDPPCQYRHRWRKGDVVIWDNRCSYHKAAGDYPPHEDRVHWRVSIKDYGASC